MDTGILEELRTEDNARALEPVLRIGKNGLTESVIAEIKKQLKKKRLIKIKLLKGYLDKGNKKRAAKEIAEKTDSELIDRVGFVVVLKKK